MNIEIVGTKSKKLIAYIERVYDYLGLDNYEALVDVEIVKESAGGAGGYANGDEDHVCIEIARNDLVGKIPTKDLMINLAHEMVHAQQMASGRLINKGFAFATSPKGVNVMTTKQIFDGQEYVGVNYNDQPWEIEAYNLETAVYEACK
jgi:hypothetical protein